MSTRDEGLRKRQADAISDALLAVPRARQRAHREELDRLPVPGGHDFFLRVPAIARFIAFLLGRKSP